MSIKRSKDTSEIYTSTT